MFTNKVYEPNNSLFDCVHFQSTENIQGKLPSRMEVDEEGPRLRQMFCSLGEISRGDGSVVWCQGETSVAASVYGPGEAKLRQTEQVSRCLSRPWVTDHIVPLGGGQSSC